MNGIGATTTTTHARNGVTTEFGLQPPHACERFADSKAARGAEQLLAEARAARVRRLTVVDFLRFAVVAFYLGSVMAWLVASRQIRLNFSVRRTLHAFLSRRRKPAPFAGIVHDAGHCYRAVVDPGMLSDAESISRVQVYEDGVPLPHPHCDHATIRQRGRGGFSHWTGAIYFSSTDNSDPRSNGRRYVYKEV